jgi:hypothetical protein
MGPVRGGILTRMKKRRKISPEALRRRRVAFYHGLSRATLTEVENRAKQIQKIAASADAKTMTIEAPKTDPEAEPSQG